MTKQRSLIGTSNGHTLELEMDSEAMYLLFDGARIARRGDPETEQVGTWIPLSPGWEIRDLWGGQAIEVLRDGQTLFH